MFRTARKATASLALIGLVLSQAAMAANSSPQGSSGAKASIASREGTPTGGAQNIAGHSGFGWLIAALVAAGALAIILADHHQNKSPASP